MAVVCLGELLVDVFSDGAFYPGGAPANVAFHAAQSGVVAALISRVGQDDPARMLLDWLSRSGVVPILTEDALHPTGAVRVKETATGPNYEISVPAAWDFIQADAAAENAVRSARVLAFGTLAQRYPVSRAAVRHLVGLARESGAIRLADLNLRPPYYDTDTILWTLRHADVLKLNEDELRIVSELLGARGEIVSLFRGLVREFSIKQAVLTCGAAGARVFEDRDLVHYPAVPPAQLIDTVGAGDAFTAVIASGLVRGRGLRDSAGRAAALASWVTGSRGATPAWDDGVRRLLDD